MTLGGWIRSYRAEMEHPVWSLSPARYKVWRAILNLAKFRPEERWDGQERFVIPAGSLDISQIDLARIARVSRKVVRGSLAALERIGSIRANARANRWTLIEVVNWDTYQSGKDEEGQPEGQPRANQGPTEGQHTPLSSSAIKGPKAPKNVRREEGKKKEEAAASGPTLAEYLSQHTAEGQEIIRQVVQAIASTRKNGKVAQSVLDSFAGRLSRYPVPAVLSGCRIYLAKNYAADGKREPYLLAIVRGEAQRIAKTSGQASLPRPIPPAKTPGQLAIERALAAQQQEQPR